MMRKKSKLELETLGKLLLLTAVLIMFLLMFKGCRDQMQNVGMVGLNEYVCWLSQSMQADLNFLFPSACHVIDVEAAQDESGVTNLIRKCWWMNGQGEKDIVSGEDGTEKIRNKLVSWEDLARTCYVFTPAKNISLTDFKKEYLEKKEGKKESAWDYIQKKGTNKEDGICFDKRNENMFIEGKNYFIIFYDDRSLFSNGERDRIFITRDPEFGKKQTGFIRWLKDITGPINPWGYGYCYGWEESERTENSKVIFNEVYTKIEKCYNTRTVSNCLCDDSEINLDYLSSEFEISIKRLSKNKYSIDLYNNDLGKNVEEKIFEGTLGTIEKSRDDMVVMAGRDASGIFCDEGLGIRNSFYLPKEEIRLVHNIDSRFYLTPPLSHPSENPMIAYCENMEIEKSPGEYQGVYILDSMAFIDPLKRPVSNYCSRTHIPE